MQRNTTTYKDGDRAIRNATNTSGTNSSTHSAQQLIIPRLSSFSNQSTAQADQNLTAKVGPTLHSHHTSLPIHHLHRRRMEDRTPVLHSATDIPVPPAPLSQPQLDVDDTIGDDDCVVTSYTAPPSLRPNSSDHKRIRTSNSAGEYFEKLAIHFINYCML